MVYSHWGLRDSPFASAIDPRRFYQSANHEEALARLHFLIDQQRRVGLLLGDAGVGKSLLLEVFACQKASATRHVVRLSLLGATVNEFLWQLAVQLGHELELTDSPFLLWHAVADQLTENRYQHSGAVLLLDDADEAHEDVLVQVARVAQFDPSPAARLSVVLAAQSRRLGNLGRRLLELADLRVDLEAWAESDTIRYVRWTLGEADCTRPIFTDEALRHLHHLTEGVPRRVKQLADMALVAGAGAELEQIDVDTVENVFQELGVAVVARR
jgi:general secretion pathway protein A